jgi:hypothetical protein
VISQGHTLLSATTSSIFGYNSVSAKMPFGEIDGDLNERCADKIDTPPLVDIGEIPPQSTLFVEDPSPRSGM